MSAIAMVHCPASASKATQGRSGVSWITWSLPTLEQLLSGLPGPVHRVIAEFCPDRLDATFEAEPHVLDGDDFFMAQGVDMLRSLRNGPPIAVARSSRC